MITTGGLGPTADDLTAEVVAEFAGVPLELDDGAGGADLGDHLARCAGAGATSATRACGPGNRKQALVPRGASVLEPVGTAPGLVVPVAGGPVRARAARAAGRAAADVGGRRLRCRPCATCSRARGCSSSGSCGSPACRSPSSRRCCARSIRRRRWRSRPACGAASSRSRPSSTRPPRPTTRRWRRRVRRAVRRAGLLARRLDDRRHRGRAAARAAGADRGGGRVVHRRADGGAADRPGRARRPTCWAGVTAYSNEAKVAHVGVPASLIERHGAVSPEVARALAAGAVERFGAALGIGITGIAGPDGGTPEKPVGTVCVCVAGAGGAVADRARGPAAGRPGGRARAHDDARDAPAAPRAARGAPRTRVTAWPDSSARPVGPRLVRPRRPRPPPDRAPPPPLRRARAPGGRPRRARRLPRRGGGPGRSGDRSPTRRSISRSPSSAAARPAT